MKQPIFLLLFILAFYFPKQIFAAESAIANLINSEEKTIGEATFSEEGSGGGVKINLKVRNISPGEHAFHIHGVGKCEVPDFKTAGSHFNPHSRKHGAKNPEGPHAGDLPNLTVGPDGTGELETIAKDVTLGDGPNSLFHMEGTSLVIHEKMDDDITDPAGNAGGRIACGVITKND